MHIRDLKPIYAERRQSLPSVWYNLYWLFAFILLWENRVAAMPQPGLFDHHAHVCCCRILLEQLRAFLYFLQLLKSFIFRWNQRGGSGNYAWAHTLMLELLLTSFTCQYTKVRCSSQTRLNLFTITAIVWCTEEDWEKSADIDGNHRSIPMMIIYQASRRKYITLRYKREMGNAWW